MRRPTGISLSDISGITMKTRPTEYHGLNSNVRTSLSDNTTSAIRWRFNFLYVVVVELLK